MKKKVDAVRNTIVIFLLSVVLGFQSCQQESSKYEIKYYENGSFESIRAKQGKKYHGESLWFYPSGMLQRKVIFENGKANGNAFTFYGSGALKARYYWRSDKQIGFQTDYLDDTVGIITSVKEFDGSGKLIDIRKTGR